MSRATPSASATRAPPSGRWSGAGAKIVAEADGTVPLSVTIAAAFGCPFEGEVDPELVARLAGEAYDGGAVEIALADSIGVGVPAQVRDLAERVRNAAPDIPLRAHFHNTRNTVTPTLSPRPRPGIAALDASTGGYGGCPFAPNATGNIATEDLAYGFHRSGIDTGVDAAMVCETATWLSGLLGKAPPALLGRAGFFPPEDSRQTPVISREGVPA